MMASDRQEREALINAFTEWWNGDAIRTPGRIDDPVFIFEAGYRAALAAAAREEPEPLRLSDQGREELLAMGATEVPEEDGLSDGEEMAARVASEDAEEQGPQR